MASSSERRNWRILPFDDERGAEAADLAVHPDGALEWDRAVPSADVRCFLHPPARFEIDYLSDWFLMILPYGTWAADVALSEGPWTRRRVTAANGVLIPSGVRFEATAVEPAEFLVLMIREDRMAKVIDQVARGAPWSPTPIFDFADPGIGTLAAEMRRALIGDPLITPGYIEAVCEAVAARFACRMLGMPIGANAREALAPGVLRKVTHHVEDTLGGALRVEDLAALAGLSRSHFSRAFRAATGQSPQDFILARRLARARELLVATQQSLAAVASAAGFSSQSHMTTVFKNRLGVSPARYRRAFGTDRGG